VKKVVYALHKTEYDDYLKQIIQNRTHAFEYFYDFLKENDPEEHLSTFSYLAEYFSILWQFEDLLEKVTLQSEWDELHQRWIVDSEVALKVVVHFHSLRTCQRELLAHNISFAIH
jgi:aromatic ring hydroxylase